MTHSPGRVVTDSSLIATLLDGADPAPLFTPMRLGSVLLGDAYEQGPARRGGRDRDPCGGGPGLPGDVPVLAVEEPPL